MTTPEDPKAGEVIELIEGRRPWRRPKIRTDLLAQSQPAPEEQPQQPMQQAVPEEDAKNG